MFYAVYFGHVFLKSSIVICYDINKLTYLPRNIRALNETASVSAERIDVECSSMIDTIAV